jgi:hypothetical protein
MIIYNYLGDLLSSNIVTKTNTLLQGTVFHHKKFTKKNQKQHNINANNQKSRKKKGKFTMKIITFTSVFLHTGRIEKYQIHRNC